VRLQTLRKLLAPFAISGVILLAQEAAQEPPQAVTIGPGVTPPKLLKKSEPKYTEIARAAKVEGNVALRVVIGDHGRIVSTEVLKPLGYGLDESARDTVVQWEFAPGRRDNAPVPVVANILVTFQLIGGGIAEVRDQRTDLARIRQKLAQMALPPAEREIAVQRLESLAKEKLPEALNLLGQWEIKGENVPRAEKAGLSKVQQAAKMNYGPALYYLATRPGELSGEETKWSEIRKAASLGSLEAQFLLADRHERGVDLAPDIGAARSYFRLCAAGGKVECQLHLANLLLNTPNRHDYEFDQAMAWFELAADQGSEEAAKAEEEQSAQLPAARKRTIANLKRQFSGQQR
jgi:TonB family protein